MTEETTRQRRSQRTREVILRVAQEVVLESGVDGLALREVARRMDYSPGALYTYFPSKDALLEALTQRFFAGLGAYLERVPGDLPTVDRLAALGQAYLDFALENPEQYLMIFNRMAPPGQIRFDQRQAAAYPWSIIVETIAEGEDSGELATSEDFRHEAVFFAFFALHHGLAMLRLTRMRGVPKSVIEPMTQSVRTAFRRCLTGGAAAPGTADPAPGSGGDQEGPTPPRSAAPGSGSRS